MQFSIAQQLAFDFSAFTYTTFSVVSDFLQVGVAHSSYTYLMKEMAKDRFVTELFAAWLVLKAPRLQGSYGDHMAALALVMADVVSQPNAYVNLKTMPPYLADPSYRDGLHGEYRVEEPGLTGREYLLPDAMSRDFFKYVHTLDEVDRQSLLANVLELRSLNIE